MTEQPNYLKRLSTHVLSGLLLLRSGSLEDIAASLHNYGAVRYGPCWLIDEEGINKIDIVGAEWRPDAGDPYWQRFRSVIEWEPSFFADAYVKGWDREASIHALRRLMIFLLEAHGGVVVCDASNRTVTPADIFNVDDLRTGSNMHGARFLT